MSDIVVDKDAALTVLQVAASAVSGPARAGVYEALAGALAAAQADEGCRVCVLLGHLDLFGSGGEEAQRLTEALDAARDAAPALQLMTALARFGKPLIAGVEGHCAGIATGVLLHADLVYAADTASFAMPVVNVGGCPASASTLLLPRVIGPRHAARALLFGTDFTAQQARRWGLVNDTVPHGQVAEFARARGANLALKPSGSLAAIKRLLRKTHLPDVLARMAEEQAVLRELLAQPAAAEAHTALASRRRPDFAEL